MSGRIRYADALLYVGSRKKCGKQKLTGEVRPCSSSALRSGIRSPRPRCHAITASFTWRRHSLRRQRRVGGELEVAETLGDEHVVHVRHAGHAVADQPHEVQVHVDERARVDRCRSRRLARSREVVGPGGPPSLRLRYTAAARLLCVGGFNCGCVSIDVVALHERLHGELPVRGQRARQPPLRPQVLDVPRVVERGERRDRSRSSAGACASKLMNAHPPQVSTRTSVRRRSVASQLASSKRSGWYMNVLAPSRPQHHPWNGQMNPLSLLPRSSTSLTPR